MDVVSNPVQIRLSDEERNNMADAADVLSNLYDAMMNYHAWYVTYGRYYDKHTSEQVSTCIDMLAALSESNNVELKE